MLAGLARRQIQTGNPFGALAIQGELQVLKAEAGRHGADLGNEHPQAVVIVLERFHAEFLSFLGEIKLAEAPMEAKPIALHDSSATGAAAFQALANEFIARLEA